MTKRTATKRTAKEAAALIKMVRDFTIRYNSFGCEECGRVYGPDDIDQADNCILHHDWQ